MQKRDIEDLAFVLSKFRLPENKDMPKPIVFIGAGASASAGIPLTGKIIKDVLTKYASKPTVKRLTEDEKKELLPGDECIICRRKKRFIFELYQ
jgi:hypothetical protein